MSLRASVSQQRQLSIDVLRGMKVALTVVMPVYSIACSKVW